MPWVRPALAVPGQALKRMRTRSSPERWDAVIIGAGHNGLTCACYLAAAGLRVRILERRSIVGGTAVTETFHPGFRNSTASYTVSLLQPKIIEDLRLAAHGLQILERPLSNFLPLPGGGSLRLCTTLADTQRELARFCARDAARLSAYDAMIGRAAGLVRETLLTAPPEIGAWGLPASSPGPGARVRALARMLAGTLDPKAWVEGLQALRLARRLGALDLAARRDLLALLARSAGDLLDSWFESDPIKAALGFDAVVGHFASPYSPGSAYVLLHHALGAVNGKRGLWGHARGGMGAITQAMAAEARARGVQISLEAPVAKVQVRAGRACGVVLESGEEIPAAAVLANIGPKLLFTRLIDRSELPEDFAQRMEGLRCGSGTLRMNVALSELPQFLAAPGTGAGMHHRSGIIMAPSLGYMDRAYSDALARGWSAQPIVEMLIPSTVDDSLAPPGQHVASLFCQQFSPTLRGASWDAQGPAAAEQALDVVESHAPGFRKSILGRQLLTPLDLEREFGLAGGDIFHGALSLDQLFWARPVLGHARYRMPVAGLYLCGAGAHPGGGVSGAPGHNAAQALIADRRRSARRYRTL
jgi:phytoene dehydrogenase-like protein